MANYYIAIDNQRRGPFPEEELLQNGMTPDSLVWCNGMEGWTRASDVPELAKYLESQKVPQVPQFDPQYISQYDQPQYPDYPQYAQEQYQQDYEDGPKCPHNFLVWAIISTVLCFPFGIPAIINAAKVKPAYEQGYYDEAVKRSRRAKIWALVGTIVGAVFEVIINIVFIAADSYYSSYPY